MSDNEHSFEYVLVVLAAGLVALLLYFVQWQECSSRGGVLAQDAIWFTCMEPKR
jgi:hypothetical protein